MKKSQEQFNKIQKFKKTLEFIYDRLVCVYHENESIDYMRAFKEVINFLTAKGF